MYKNPGSTPAEEAKGAEYEAPEVERVMDAEELDREVHYAGSPVSS